MFIFIFFKINQFNRTSSFGILSSLSFIVGGGIGNMIDRTALGYVVDMIDLRLINFAVFNVADSFVCVGAGLMILYLILDMIREAKEEKAKSAVSPEGGHE